MLRFENTTSYLFYSDLLLNLAIQICTLKLNSINTYPVFIKERLYKYLYFVSVSCNRNYRVHEIHCPMFTVHTYRLGKKVLEQSISCYVGHCKSNFYLSKEQCTGPSSTVLTIKCDRVTATLES